MVFKMEGSHRGLASGSVVQPCLVETLSHAAAKAIPSFSIDSATSWARGAYPGTSFTALGGAKVTRLAIEKAGQNGQDASFEDQSVVLLAIALLGYFYPHLGYFCCSDPLHRTILVTSKSTNFLITILQGFTASIQSAGNEIINLQLTETSKHVI